MQRKSDMRLNSRIHDMSLESQNEIVCKNYQLRSNAKGDIV